MNTGTSTDPNTQPDTASPSYFPPESQHRKRNGPAIAGMALIVIGSLFLMENIFPDFCFEDYWPLILVAIGLGLLMSARKKESTQS
jgi:hypothetical protein